jgi:hypothetical protein
MNTSRSLWLVALTTAVCAFCFGCAQEGGDDGQAADQLYQTGMTELQDDLSGADTAGAPWEWGVDVSDAYEHFDDAAQADPAHCGSLIMSAATRLLMVVTDPELAGILESLFPEDPSPSRASAIFWYTRKPDFVGLTRHLQTASRSDFHFSELQSYIESDVLPALEYADQRLTDFEEYDCTVTVVVEGDSLAGEMTIEIDATDAYFLHTALDAVQMGCNMAVAYNVDIDDGQSPEYLIETDSNFLTLRSAGAMPAAYDEIAAMADHLNAACDALEAETDDQTDDVITLTDGYVALEDLLGADALQQIRDVADTIDNALVNGLALNPADMDPPGPDVDVLVDLNELLNDPVQDLREYFPAHSWPQPDSVSIARPIDFPYPEFDGITPGMTDEEWELIILWMEQ